MIKKIILILVAIILLVITIFGLYYMFNGGISSFVSTTKNASFWQAIKDLFVGLYNGFLRTIGVK